MTTDRSRAARRISLGIATIAALITATTGVAQAQGGDHRLPIGNTPADIPADVCGFPIHIGVIDDREYRVQQTADPDGSTTTRVTGTLKNRLTNMNTGTYIDYDNGGPGTFTVHPDGRTTFDFQGHSMAWIRAAYQTRLGAPALRLTSGGHVVGTIDASGDIVDLSTTGHVVDGCALLS